jgi:hypothetical protein
VSENCGESKTTSIAPWQIENSIATVAKIQQFDCDDGKKIDCDGGKFQRWKNSIVTVAK